MMNENVPVLKPIGKGRFYVYCPFCGKTHTFSTDEKEIEQVIYNEEGRTRIVQKMKSKALCSVCGEKFVIDFGKSTYTIYDPPIYKDYKKCWTTFESDWYYNFTIVIFEPFNNPQRRAYIVQCENSDYTFLLHDPFMDDLYMKPKKILELGMAHGDSGLY